MKQQVVANNPEENLPTQIDPEQQKWQLVDKDLKCDEHVQRFKGNTNIMWENGWCKKEQNSRDGKHHIFN